MGTVIESNTPPKYLEQESLYDNVTTGKWRYRVLYSKLGPIRYISNLDLARLWERICRRAKLPLAYSQGFNPRPKIQLAAGLPLGYLSTFEIVDLWVLKQIGSLSDLAEELNRMSPDGVKIISIHIVDHAQPALQAITDRAIYQVRLIESCPDDLPSRLAAFSKLTTCLRSRRDKQYDLRPLVDKLRLTNDKPPLIEMTLAMSQKRGTARPDEVMDALGLSAHSYDVTRVGLVLEAPYELGL